VTSTAIILLVVKVSLALAVLAIGLRSQEGDAVWLVRHPGLLVRSLLSMNVIVPLVALAVTQALDLRPPVRLAIVALSLSPVPPILPHQTGKAGGEAAYSVGLLTIASLMAVVLVPVSAWIVGTLFGMTVHVMPRAVAVLMAQTVLAPLGVGVLIRHLVPAFAVRAARPVNLIGMLALAFAFLLVLTGAWPAMRSLLDSRAVLAAVLVAGAALLVGHELGGPDDLDRPVLALASVMRHPAVAIAIGHAAFPENKLVVPAVLLQFVVAALAALPYVRWEQRVAARRPPPRITLPEARLETAGPMRHDANRKSRPGRRGPMR
jgi:BASS family bile acid:Na+ symporter